ncbi:unnamed protein product [Nesidiocoris tenuis]|uniref:Fibronectin type-III domain-containing protein n=1 Tax=Nesidiocoris tenuis TaxID=355587 RepID=A0A6H5GD64_9HEMI|nr:unnamed protein product [Nesidiocoris tenuis]
MSAGDVPKGAAAFGVDACDTRLLFFGGMVEFGNYSNKLHCLDVSPYFYSNNNIASKWEWKELQPKPPRFAPSPSPRLGHSFTYINGKFYLFGGLSNEMSADDGLESTNIYSTIHVKYLNDLYVLDYRGNSGVWEMPQTYGSPPPPRESHSAVSHVDSLGNAKLLIYGGMAGLRLGDLWILDINSLTWHQPLVDGPKPLPRSLHISAVVGDRMYIFGGWVPKTPDSKIFDREWICTNSLARLNLNTMMWEQFEYPEVCPQARAGHCAVVVGSRIYVWSGRDGYTRQYNTQVCCNDLWYLEVAKPDVGERVHLIKANTTALEVTWPEVPFCDHYVLQILKHNITPVPKPVAPKKRKVEADFDKACQSPSELPFGQNQMPSISAIEKAFIDSLDLFEDCKPLPAKGASPRPPTTPNHVPDLPTPRHMPLLDDPILFSASPIKSSASPIASSAAPIISSAPSVVSSAASLASSAVSNDSPAAPIVFSTAPAVSSAGQFSIRPDTSLAVSKLVPPSSKPQSLITSTSGTSLANSSQYISKEAPIAQPRPLTPSSSSHPVPPARGVQPGQTILKFVNSQGALQSVRPQQVPILANNQIVSSNTVQSSQNALPGQKIIIQKPVNRAPTGQQIVVMNPTSTMPRTVQNIPRPGNFNGAQNPPMVQQQNMNGQPPALIRRQLKVSVGNGMTRTLTIHGRSPVTIQDRSRLQTVLQTSQNPQQKNLKVQLGGKTVMLMPATTTAAASPQSGGKVVFYPSRSQETQGATLPKSATNAVSSTGNPGARLQTAGPKFRRVSGNEFGASEKRAGDTVETNFIQVQDTRNSISPGDKIVTRDRSTIKIVAPRVNVIQSNASSRLLTTAGPTTSPSVIRTAADTTSAEKSSSDSSRQTEMPSSTSADPSSLKPTAGAVHSSDQASGQNSSQERPAKPMEGQTPPPPSNIRIAKASDGAVVSWTPPTEGNPTSYCVNLGLRVGTCPDKVEFATVYEGPEERTKIGQSLLDRAVVGHPRPAIIFRVSSQNINGQGPSTQRTFPTNISYTWNKQSWHRNRWHTEIKSRARVAACDGSRKKRRFLPRTAGSVSYPDE